MIVIVVIRSQLSTKMRLTKSGIVRDMSAALDLGQQKIGTVLKSEAESGLTFEC
jgi:hypothetical protein